MKIRIKEEFRDEFSKEYYEVIGINPEMTFFKIINDDNNGDWVGDYLVEEVISNGYFTGEWSK